MIRFKLYNIVFYIPGCTFLIEWSGMIGKIMFSKIGVLFVWRYDPVSKKRIES